MRLKNKLWSAVLVILLFSSPFYGIDMTIFGSFRSFLSCGDANDYKVGENEFPITDSHRSYGFGVAVNSHPVGSVFLGLEASYQNSSPVIVRDPVDDDWVEINSYKHCLTFLTLGYRFIKGKKVSIFTQGGGGVFILLDESEVKRYTTAKGFIVEIEPTEKKVGPAGFLGLGLELSLSRSIGITVSGRYLFIGAYESQSAITAQIGLRLLL